MLWVSGSTGLESPPHPTWETYSHLVVIVLRTGRKKERKNKQPSPRPPQCCLSDSSDCVKGCSWKIWCTNSIADPFASGCASEPPQSFWLSRQCARWVLTHFNPLQSTRLNCAGNWLQIKPSINMLKMSLSSDKVAMHIKFLTRVY